MEDKEKLDEEAGRQSTAAQEPWSTVKAAELLIEPLSKLSSRD